MGAAAREQDVGLDLDLDPEIRAPHDHEILLHQVIHRALDLVGDLLQCLGSRRRRIVLRRRFRGHGRQTAGIGVALGLDREQRAGLTLQHRLLDDRSLDVGARADLLLADLDRSHGARSPAKGGKQRVGQHPILAGIHRRNGIHHDEEGEQQGHQVAVRDRPRLVVDVVLVPLRPACHGWFSHRDTSRP